MGHYDSSISHFEKVLKLGDLPTPNQVNSLNRLGQSYQGLGEFDECLKRLFEALSIQEAEVFRKNEDNLILHSRIQLSIGTVLDEISVTLTV